MELPVSWRKGCQASSMVSQRFSLEDGWVNVALVVVGGALGDKPLIIVVVALTRDSHRSAAR